MSQANPQLKKMDDATRQAADWFVILSSGSATHKDRQTWQAWRESAPKNDQAWMLLEKVTSQFKQLPVEGVHNSLQRLYDQPQSNSKRIFLKQLGIFFVMGSASYLGYRERPWQTLLADQSTAIGERKDITLVDGTRLWINTATVVDIQFTEKQRVITLIKGEIFVETGHEKNVSYRPFIVKTQYGSAQALGTRFNVRHFESYSHISVFEGAVNIIPNDSKAAPYTLKAGQSANFGSKEMTSYEDADPATVAWTHGFLIADNMPLGDFISELSRYRSGFLRCDPAIAQLKISGSYSIDNTDLTLDALSHQFPIRVKTLTRYWTNLLPL